jgi:hypothetical protein
VWLIVNGEKYRWGVLPILSKETYHMDISAIAMTDTVK